MLGFSSWSHDDTGTRASSFLWLYHLIGPQIPLLDALHLASIWRGKERVEDLAGDFGGAQLGLMCLPPDILHWPEVKSVIWPRLTAGAAGKCSPAMSTGGKGSRLDEHMAVSAIGPQIRPQGLGLSRKSGRPGKQEET